MTVEVGGLSGGTEVGGLKGESTDFGVHLNGPLRVAGRWWPQTVEGDCWQSCEFSLLV